MTSAFDMMGRSPFDPRLNTRHRRAEDHLAFDGLHPILRGGAPLSLFGNNEFVDLSQRRVRPTMPSGGPVGVFGGVIPMGPEFPGPGDLPAAPEGPFLALPVWCHGMEGMMDTRLGWWNTDGYYHNPMGNGSFMDLIPDPDSGGQAFEAFWGAWQVENGNCLWWIINNGNLPNVSTDHRPPDNNFATTSDLYRRLKHCHPPPIRGKYPCFSPAEWSRGLPSNVSTAYSDPPQCSRAAWDEAIGDAWRILQQNVDVIRWLGCVLDPDLGDCLAHSLSPASDISTTFTFESSAAGGMNFTIAGSSQTHISLNVDENEMCKGIMSVLSDPSCDAVCRDCEMALLSATMLHELTHYCGYRSGVRYDKTGGEDRPGECDVSYMMASAFRWAMSWRYGWISDAQLCRGTRDPRLLFYDDNSNAYKNLFPV